MYGGIESSRIIRAFQRHVPECYVRDYTSNRGYLTICKGYKDVFDSSKWSDKFTQAIPAYTLANLNPGYTPEKSIYAGNKLIVPGWRVEMRRAAEYLTPNQCMLIERELGFPVFNCH